MFLAAPAWLDGWYPNRMLAAGRVTARAAFSDALFDTFATERQSHFNPAMWTLRLHLFGHYVLLGAQVRLPHVIVPAVCPRCH